MPNKATSAWRWDKLVLERREVIENFRDNSEDNAIVWADKEMKNYKRAMMLLVEKLAGCKDDQCAINLLQSAMGKDDRDFVMTMIRRAKAQS